MTITDLFGMNQSVTLLRAADTDELDDFGRPVGDDTEYQVPARWVRKSDLVLAQDGEETRASDVVWVPAKGHPGLPPLASDRVRLPDGREVWIQSPEAYPDPSGEIHHYKLWLSGRRPQLGER